MKFCRSFAPAHTRSVCVGVFVVVGFFGAGCENAPHIGTGRSNRTLELSSDTIQLASGVNLHDVQVKSAPQSIDFHPTELTARTGDVIRFTVSDNRTHALVVTSATPESSAALRTSNQLRSPPLVSQGQSWVISLKGVPAGTYTVSCVSHAGTATIMVQ